MTAEDLAAKTDPALFGGGRRRGDGHYSAAGIRRVLCSRAGCGRHADTEWSACADGNKHRPLCGECDVALNAVALAWWGDPQWRAKLIEYVGRLSRQIGRDLDPDALRDAEREAERMSAQR